MQNPEPRKALIEIDMDGVVGDSEAFHKRLADALSFPEYYGRNADALWDCLTSEPMPLKLIVWGLDSVASRDYEMLSRCLIDFREELPDEAPEFELHWERRL